MKAPFSVRFGKGTARPFNHFYVAQRVIEDVVDELGGPRILSIVAADRFDTRGKHYLLNVYFLDADGGLDHVEFSALEVDDTIEGKRDALLDSLRAIARTIPRYDEDFVGEPEAVDILDALAYVGLQPIVID